MKGYSMVMAPLALAIIATGCQKLDHVDPQDENTGSSFAEGTFFQVTGESASKYLDANLLPTNSLLAVFDSSTGVIRPAKVGGVYPPTSGLDADLLNNVGFGVYANTDYTTQQPWEESGAFASTLTAQIELSGPGDSIRFCRTVGSMCVQAVMEYGEDSFTGVIIDVGASLPDTEVGVVDEELGVSAAIRDVGPDQLKISLWDPAFNRQAVDFVAGQTYELAWHLERGVELGTLEYGVSVDGEQLGNITGNTADSFWTAIELEGGVALRWTTEEPLDGIAGLDYGYSYHGQTGEFEDPFGVGVPLSPQPNLMNTPVLLFPTNDIGYGVVGLGGEPGSPHLATFADGIVGRNVTRTGSGNEVVVTSVAFNGDDFFGTALEGQVDFGLPGGGFYGSVPLCYSQILPLVEEGVRELTRDTVRQIMYAGMGNGVATADVSLEVLSNELINSFGLPESQVGYTRLGSVFSGQIDNYVTIGTDYAENNVDAYITTPHTSTLNVVWTSDVSTNFRSELGGIIEALEADDYQIRDLFIANGAISMDDYNNLKLLQNAMTAPNGFKDGVIAPDGTPMPDNFTPPYQTDTCGGFECLVAWIIEDIINGTNNSGNNADQPPLLAAGCLFGLAGTPEIAPQPATITGDSLGDTPATELVEAVEPVTPGREQSAESVNELVVTVHTTFVDLAYGPAVPASNFSLSMATGQPDVGGPGVHSIEISKE